MEKETIIAKLKELADLLEVGGANSFESGAFRKAANAIEAWDGDLEQAINESTLTEIPSVGKGTAAVITELMTTGDSADHRTIREQIPDELPKLLRFRGLGPKRVRVLWQELDIKSPDELETAINEGSVSNLKGFGAKTVEKMLASIEYFRGNERTPKAAPKLDQVPKAIASTGKILAGTSGYSYPDWKGSFYPEKAKTTELLKHYATELETVEINNTFYRFPSAKVVEQWKTQTPKGFQFALKAHRRVTHQMRLSKATQVRIQEFVDRCSVLGSRLGCVLFQLPPDFERDDERLANLLEAIPEGPRYAIEFRHDSWFDNEVLERLGERNVACVCGDSAGDVASFHVTADFVYVRLRKEVHTKKELDEWNRWFTEQTMAKRDVLLYLKHDDSGDVPNTIVERWAS